MSDEPIQIKIDKSVFNDDSSILLILHSKKNR